MWIFALGLGFAGIAYDGIDRDGDGWVSVLAGGADCDDRDPRVNPGTRDVPGDRVDADCGGSDGPDGWSAWRRWRHARGRPGMV